MQESSKSIESLKDTYITSLSTTNVPHFFPSDAFLRRRRNMALLRVNDRGGGWRMCILALCRACVCVRLRVLYVRAPLSKVLYQLLKC